MRRILAIGVAVGMAALASTPPVAAENISIPGYGELTLFAVANGGLLVQDGALGATVEGDTQSQFQTVKSVVGVNWNWDIGYSHKLLAHYEYGGEFAKFSETIDDAKPFRSWIGVSNALGALTYGKQPTGYFKNYGTLIDRSQDFYATGYTTPHAGGIKIESDIIKYATSYGRWLFDVDYRPAFVGNSTAVDSSIGVSGQFRQYLGRITFGGGWLREELRGGGDRDRVGGAVEYRSEQWSLAFGAHLLDDATPHRARSLNLLGTFQLTQDNALHLSLATIDDDDVYESFHGTGFYLDQRFGSQWRIYSEGALTRAEAAGGGPHALNTQILFGIRYDFGNVFY
ncbi:MAG: porin [Rhodospirillaceae bacterium]|nr:porin [Rhodospirillaceae bacterium]MBT4905851.1 porin [Rhodospirillaceae bacterium]MBT5357158.1 porin [Rhodospirillaceae bacterium]MBT5770386.1 porin [Rhodospirillaceae bacterium]MBT6310981.1 porin [Rhodospirillaceae bacterium]